MGLARNIVSTVAVTGILIGGLLVLFPETAQGATSTLTKGSISAIDGSGDINIQMDVTIPAGEHWIFDHASVTIVNETGFGLDGDGDLTGTYVPCTGGGIPTTTNGNVAITAITGASSSFGAFLGYGYEVQENSNGYGYDFVNRAELTGFTGSGYGYGDASAEVEVTLNLTVSNCNFFPSAGVQTETFRFQVHTGPDASSTIKSKPVQKTLFNPNFVGTGSTTSSTVTVDTETQADGSSSTEILIVADGNSKNISGGSTISFGSGFSITQGDVTIKEMSMVLKSDVDLPTGASMTFDYEPTDSNSLTDPDLGIDATALDGETDDQPAFFFKISVFVPGVGEIDLDTATAAVDSVSFTADVDEDYFNSVGGNHNRFELRGFNSLTGGLKDSHPQRLSHSDSGTTHTYTFKISDFSSFAGIIAPNTGGGSNSGGSSGDDDDDETTTTTTTTTTTSDETDTGTTTTTTTSASTETGTETTQPSATDTTTTEEDTDTGTTSDEEGPEEKKGFPGFEAVLLVTALLAAAGIALRRRL